MISFSASTGVSFMMLCLFAVIAVGYLFGKISIKGISLGSAGVFIIALAFGCAFYNPLSEALKIGDSSYVNEALKIIESIGLMFFVTSVGFIAGPTFINNIKKHFKSYVLLGVCIIAIGTLSCIACIFIERRFSDLSVSEVTAMMVGLYSGALTSTPSFSAAKDTVAAGLDTIVATGHGIAYLYGVLGKVLFIQIIPKIVHADMDKERQLLISEDEGKRKEYTGKLIDVDQHGFMAFSLAVMCGVVVGGINIGNFSLTTTGGCLLAGLVFGHFAHIGKINIMPPEKTLQLCRELGLILFLACAGISGGSRFIELFEPIYFLYGIIMSTIPMIVGFLFAKYVLRLPLLNNLGALTGGMTSTPALGALINVAQTENVVAAYAATYPIALILVVIATQLMVVFFS